MSKFSKFMKSNKVAKANVRHAPTQSLLDEKGNPVEFEFRHLTSKEVDDIRDDCSYEVPIKGKGGVYRQKVNTRKFNNKIITASIVVPDLRDSELQNSYGVSTPEDLLYALVDDPGEHADLLNYVSKLQGFNVSLEEKIEEAKN